MEKNTHVTITIPEKFRILLIQKAAEKMIQNPKKMITPGAMASKILQGVLGNEDSESVETETEDT